MRAAISSKRRALNSSERKKSKKKAKYSTRDTKVKGKGHPKTGHEGPEWEQMYSSTLS